MNAEALVESLRTSSVYASKKTHASLPDVTLPTGWTWARLGEVCGAVAKTDPTQKPDDIFTYVDISSIDNAVNRVVSAKTLVGREAPSRARQVLRRGDTVFSTVRTYLKNIAYVDQNLDGAVASTGFCVLRPLINPKYVSHFVLGEGFLKRLEPFQRGTSYPAVRDGDVFEQPIPVPPLEEQEDIVAKIDELFSDIDAGVRSMGEVGRLLPATHASLLDAAFSGLLSGEELDSASGLPCGWRWTTLGDEDLTEIEAGLTKNPRRESLPSRLPYLRVANVYKNELRLDEMKTIGVTEAEARQKALRAGDLLVVEGNGSRDQIGRVALWDGSIAPVVHQNHIIRVRFSDAVNAHFALYWLMSARGRSAVVERASTTSGLYTLSKSKVASLPLPVTDRATQDHIVAVVDAELSRLAAVGRYVTDAGLRSEALRQSVLAAAFSGQLI